MTSASLPQLGGGAESFLYDPLGNRLRKDAQATDSIIGAGNRLLGDQFFTYNYDANGNLASRTEILTLDVTTCTYDAENRLTRIDFPGLAFAAYTYDGLGRRMEKNVDGTVTRYVYDGSDILLEYDGTNVLQARYSHGDLVDQPLALERASQSYFYQTDHLGSVLQLTDSLGGIANSYTYDGYGRIEALSETVANPYFYTAREFDAESGLYYYRARYYDPQTGRFTQEDPTGFGAGDANLYRYVFNNPTNLTDPTGRVPIVVAGCIGGAIGGVVGGFAGNVAGAAIVTGLAINEGIDEALGPPNATPNGDCSNSEPNDPTPGPEDFPPALSR